MVTPRILLLDEHTAALDRLPRTSTCPHGKIISERHITCLMVTHNMHQALSLGNRNVYDGYGGHIVFHVSGEERKKLTIDNLLEQFKMRAGKQLDNDRILLSK